MIKHQDFIQIMGFMGFKNLNTQKTHCNRLYSGKDTTSVICSYKEDGIAISACFTSGRKVEYTVSENATDIIECIDKIYCMCDPKPTTIDKRIVAAINTKNLAQNLVRVKSSNVWGYAFDVESRKAKTGNLIVQFKDKNGGPGHVYIYYDFPTMLYRKWQSAPSKGHFFWQYIRHNFKYSKLTGNKRGILPNAVNSTM